MLAMNAGTGNKGNCEKIYLQFWQQAELNQ